MPDVASYRHGTERVVRTLQLLAKLESDEERGCSEWDADLAAIGGEWPLKCAVDLLGLGGGTHQQVCRVYLTAKGATRASDELLPSFDLVADAAERYVWDPLVFVSLVSFSTAGDDALRWTEPPDPLDLASRMAAESVGDDPRRQLEFIISEMDPDLRRDFQAFAGAVTTSFEIDEAYLESDPSHGQDDCPTG